LHGDTGDVACDHYNRLDEDLDLMAKLGLKSYRFSVSWPRVRPGGRGAANQAGVDFYTRLVDGLLERGIRPALTLHHWDLPQELEDEGGWLCRDTAERFGEFADIVAQSFSDRVDLWMTLNEPYVMAWLGYGAGIFAPGKAEIELALRAHHHVLLAHARSLEVLRSYLSSSAEVGVALNLMQVYPASDHPADVAAARLADGQFNRSFLEPIFLGHYPRDQTAYLPVWDEVTRDGDLESFAAPVDFIGINNYHSRLVAANDRLDVHWSNRLLGEPNQLLAFGLDTADVLDYDVPKTATGWPITPDGLRDLIVRLHDDYSTPVYITENGAAFDDYASPEGTVNDPERISYLAGHIRAVAEAIERGAEVRGYFVWSLFDNFEWAAGYAKRFGIVYIDFPTSRRTPKASFEWYRRVIEENGIS
jgi:beta-glucosidase